MVTDISISECLSEGWAFYKRHMGITLGAIVLLYIIMFVGQSIPILGYLFALLVGPPLSFGLYYVILNVARDNHPKIEDIFFGFKRYGTLMGLYFLIVAVMMLCLSPTIIYALVLGLSTLNSDHSVSGLFAGGFIAVAFLNTLAALVCFYRFWMVHLVVVDDPRLGVFDALKRSSEITKGNGHNVILLIIVSGLIAIGLALALILPLIIFGPMLGVAYARCYLKLRQMHDTPAEPAYPAAPQPLA